MITLNVVLRKNNQKKIRFEVKRYLELVDKYVDLQNGIKIKKITK